MRIMWLCNKMPGIVASEINEEISNKEGWIDGIISHMLGDEKCNIELAVTFPSDLNESEISGTTKDGIEYFSFKEDLVNLDKYDEAVEDKLDRIIGEYNPDIIHIYGTEYPHALAISKVLLKEEYSKIKTVVGIQGMMGLCANTYTLGIPEHIQKRNTFRDLIKKDNILNQKEKFFKRALNERKLLENVEYVIGRTAADKKFTEEINPNRKYYKLNETLRSNFYDTNWRIESSNSNTILVTQADYPIKGFHYLLEALAIVCKVKPELNLIVTGNQITKYNTLKEKIKIGSYGLYIRQLIRKYNLEKNIKFEGMVNAKLMEELMLSSRILVSPSIIENSPNSVGEAMLLGLPVISSRVGGVPSIIDDKEEGLLYNYDDIKELARLIIEVMDNDELAKKISKAGQEKARITHNRELNYNRMIEIYEEII